MKILLIYTLVTIDLISNIQCISQPQNQPTSYASNNIQTHYRQIENYIKPNVVSQQQQQSNPGPNLYQTPDDSQYQIVPNNQNYYQDKSNVQQIQSKAEDNYNNQQPQVFYVKADRPSPQIQEQYQPNNQQYLLSQQDISLNNQNQNLPTASQNYDQGEAQYTLQSVQQLPDQMPHYPNQIPQNPESRIIQSQADLIPAQQQTIPVQQYSVQNQPDNPVYQPQQPEQFYPQQQQPQELPQNIPQHYNFEVGNERPQTASYPAYQQVLENNEPVKPKQSTGYKVRESPVERQTEEFSPGNNPFAGHQITRDSQLFHDIAVHGSYSDGNEFGQLNYQNQQISRGQQPVQQLSPNTYNVFSDSLQGQQNTGLSAYGTANGTPQYRLLNSGL